MCSSDLVSEMAQPEREVRELRNDLASFCAVVKEGQESTDVALAESLSELKAVASHTSGLPALLTQLDLDLVQLHQDATAAGGVPVSIAGQSAPVGVEAPEGFEVSNPPNVAAVQAAVKEGTETANQNVWAALGMIAGAIGIAFIWRLVRP